MSPRLVLVLLVLLGAGITVKLAMRSHARSTGSVSGSATPAPTATPPPPPPMPPPPPLLEPVVDPTADTTAERPALPPLDPMARDPGSAAPIGADVYATEQRDDAWATPVERELRKRLDPLGRAMVRSTECRQHQCKLVLAGAEHDLERAIGFLESTEGLQRYAASILLTAPTPAPDGSLELTAYVVFNRN